MAVEYRESLEEAAQIARSALPLASEYELPANPINYSVFYEYVSGQNPELSQALDRLRLQPEQLNAEQIRSLYQSFICYADEQALKEVRLALAKIVETTQGSLAQVDQQSQVYQQSLGEASQQLLQGHGAHSPADIIANLIDETVRMQGVSQSLQDELARTNKDLAQLRTEFQRVRQESLLDPLTGIKNRRAFDHSLKECCEQARAQGEELCLLMVDIDHFKKINDQHGHVVGDAVLKWVSAAINDTVRGADILARFGGEEFVVLLPATPMVGAERVADNICNKLRNQKCCPSEQIGDIGRVTVSVGVARYSLQETEEEFVNRSDVALYRAKQSGRNRVCTDEVA
jgi:diguanylate cyclase